MSSKFAQATHAACESYYSRHRLGCAAGALRQALLIGYDLPRMEGLWPSDKQCPGFKYVTASVHLCTPVSALRSSWHMSKSLELLHTSPTGVQSPTHVSCGLHVVLAEVQLQQRLFCQTS